MRCQMCRNVLAVCLFAVLLSSLLLAETDLLGTLEDHNPQDDKTNVSGQNEPTILQDQASTGQTGGNEGSLFDKIFDSLMSILERITKILEKILKNLGGGIVANPPGGDNGAKDNGKTGSNGGQDKPNGGQDKPDSGTDKPIGGAPNGRAAIEKMFGAPGTNQVTTTMPAGRGGKNVRVTCNAKIADKLKAVFEEIKAQGLSDEIHSFDGCYNNRNKRGGSSKSTHAWGIAVDINASENPMGSSKQTAGQKKIAAIFAKHGFHQLPNDPMHFQYCTGY